MAVRPFFSDCQKRAAKPRWGRAFLAWTTIGVRVLGRVRTESNIEIENRNGAKNKALIGPWPKTFFAFVFEVPRGKKTFCNPLAKINKLTADNRKGKSKTRTTTIEHVLLVSAVIVKNITPGPLYTASNPQLARRHSRTASRRTPTPAPTLSDLCFPAFEPKRTYFDDC